MHALTKPKYLYSRSEILSKPSPIPEERGLYAWFFKEVPDIVPTEGCVVKDKLTLLYIGISPANDNSKHNLRKRINIHFKGDAKSSTLRQTLGVLLTKKSSYPLRRVGNGNRMTFTSLGESWLDSWMERNAFVCWVLHPSPWEIEGKIIKNLSLPLNIQDNKKHFFYSTLKKMRKLAKDNARMCPILTEKIYVDN